MPIWIPPAERRRFKGLDMAHKTKATMPGRQCSTENKQQDQHTRPVAGGQRSGNAIFSASGTAPTAQLNHNILISKQSSNLSLVSSKIVGCILSVGGTAMQHTPEKSRSFDRYPDIGYQSLPASLVFLRWRRLISPCMDAMINWEVLSFSTFTNSIASTISCGTLAFNDCDLAFVVPVAITGSPLIEWATVYTKKYSLKALTWTTPKNYSGPHLDSFKVKAAKPGSASNTNRASDHNVIGANNMADLQHTKTRPEFIRPKHVNHAEKAIAQIVHAKAILALIASQDTNSAAVENALEAITEMLERAEEELAEVRHA